MTPINLDDIKDAYDNDALAKKLIDSFQDQSVDPRRDVKWKIKMGATTI